MTQPETVTLRPGKLKWGIVLLACLVFAGAGTLIFIEAPGGRAGGVAAMLFFGGGALVSTLQIVANSRLVLSPEGFTIFGLGRRLTTRWTEVASFSVVAAGASPINRMVAVNLAGADRLGRARAAARAVLGYDRLLPDTYGMKAQDLAALLDEWRARHSRAPSGD